MKTYHYGELIHWGNRREEYSEITSVSPEQRHYIKFRFLEAAQYLGHFYVGVGALIDLALTEN